MKKKYLYNKDNSVFLSVFVVKFYSSENHNNYTTKTLRLKN